MRLICAFPGSLRRVSSSSPPSGSRKRLSCALTISASATILGIDVRSFRARAEGELILGPFDMEGTAEAKAIGNGDWTAEVASNRAYDATLETAGSLPEMTLHGGVWEGGRCARRERA